MKCPKCGKEIANDSQFCEFCGTQVKAMPHQVNSGLVAWIMFLFVVCFSAAEMFCVCPISGIRLGYVHNVANFTKINFLCIAFVNLSVFVINIVLARKKQFRKSTSIALCLMSVFIAIGAIMSTFEMYVEDQRIFIDEFYSAFSILSAGVIAGVYAIYWLIAKVMHINF